MLNRFVTLILFTIIANFAILADDGGTKTIPVTKDTDPNKGHRPKSLPGHDICDDVDCYWQDGTLYINFAIPEGDATVILWRSSGVTSYGFSTSEGAAIPCGPDYDIIRLEIHTDSAIYYNVSNNDNDFII